jgi:hypothetical protein
LGAPLTLSIERSVAAPIFQSNSDAESLRVMLGPFNDPEHVRRPLSYLFAKEIKDDAEILAPAPRSRNPLSIKDADCCPDMLDLAQPRIY